MTLWVHCKERASQWPQRSFSSLDWALFFDPLHLQTTISLFYCLGELRIGSHMLGGKCLGVRRKTHPPKRYVFHFLLLCLVLVSTLLWTLPMVTLTHFHFDPLHVQLRLKLSKLTKDITADQRYYSVTAEWPHTPQDNHAFLLIRAPFSVGSICLSYLWKSNTERLQQGGQVRPGAPGSGAPDYLLSHKPHHTIPNHRVWDGLVWYCPYHTIL